MKLTYLVSIMGGHVAARLPPIIRFMIKQNSIWSKALIMSLTIWNCVSSYKGKSYFSENWLVFPRNHVHYRIPGSNLLLPTFLAGSKWDFPVANLLFATVNFEH